MGSWTNQNLTVQAKGLNADTTVMNLGLAPGLYKVKIVDGDVVNHKSDSSKSPNLKLTAEVIQGQGEGCSAAGIKDEHLYVSTDQKEEFSRRNQKALALSVGYAEAEVEQDTFTLQPQRVIGQEAFIWAQQNGVNDKGYPNVDRRFIPRALVPKKVAEIAANGGKVPYGLLGKDGRKDGGVGAAVPHAGMPAGAPPNFGAPAPVAGAAPAGFGAPAPAFGAAPVAAPFGAMTAPAIGQPNGAPAGFAVPDLGAMGGQGALKV